MAALTATNTPTRHVRGDLVTRYFTISGNSGDTLATSVFGILFVDVQLGSTITAIAAVPSTGVITFTSSAPYVNAVIEVTGTRG